VGSKKSSEILLLDLQKISAHKTSQVKEEFRQVRTFEGPKSCRVCVDVT
jgi:hypothetical protein